METRLLDLTGLSSPQPTMRITIEADSCQPGDNIEAVADSITFVDDIKTWCTRKGKTLLWVKDEGVQMRVLIKV